MIGRWRTHSKVLFSGLLALFLFLSSTAHAACTNPTAREGTVVYNEDQNVPQVCAGNSWNALGALNPSAGAGSCSNPSAVEGTIVYNDDFDVLQYCNGTNWVATQAAVEGSSFVSAVWQTITTVGDGDSACGITDASEAWCWGRNTQGELGNDNTGTDEPAPVLVGTAGTSTLWSDWTKIAGSTGVSACGIRSNGEAYCWGDNVDGQSGNGNTTDQPYPVRVGTAGTSTLWSDWESIALGNRTTCGIRTNGEAYCWGRGENGRLGDGTTTPQQTTPVRVGTAGTSTLWSDWAVIAVGDGGSTCGVRDNGEAYCWGRGPNGELGDGTTTDPQTTPVRVGTAGTSTLWSDWESVTVGFDHACGIRTNGEAYCWGDGSTGVLGNGLNTNPQTTPVRVGTGGSGSLFSDWAAIAGRGNHVCGIRDNGTAWCWGNNDEGQLGNGTFVGTFWPVQVGTLQTGTVFSDFQTIDASGEFGCGIRSDGTAWCWGGLYGYTNQNVYNISLPIQVGFGDPSISGGGVSGISVGGYLWYLSNPGDSCTDACSAHGGYDAATSSYAGSSDANCQNVLDALITTGPTVTPIAFGQNLGCVYGGGSYYRDTSGTTEGASSAGVYRACACSN